MMATIWLACAVVLLGFIQYALFVNQAKINEEIVTGMTELAKVLGAIVGEGK